MKKILQSVSIIAFLAIILFVVSCNQDEQNLNSDPDKDLSQIAKLEKEEGITFFKKDFTYTSGGNNAVLTIATRNEDVFKNFIENLDVILTPLYEVPKNAVSTNDSHDSHGSEPSDSHTEISGEEIIIEFTKLERTKGVIGIEATYHLKNTELLEGRTRSHGYDMYVNHYSNHWPSTFSLETVTPANRTGVHFYARWKWYQGYGSRTVCIISSWCSLVGACAQDFDLYGGNCKWTWNVDGPYQMQAKIGWFSGEIWKHSWTY